MKRFAIILLVIGALVTAGPASAQMRGGGARGGGGAHAGGGWHGGGGSHGGSSWHRGGTTHAGGHWHGGGHRHGGWGWHGGTSVAIGIGGWGWWPGYYPYPYYYPYPGAYGYPYSGYGDYYPGPYEYGTYVQGPDAASQGGQQQYQGGPVTSDGYSYYCPNPAGYYPQVPTCAAGWLRVVPQGAGQTAPAQP